MRSGNDSPSSDWPRFSTIPPPLAPALLRSLAEGFLFQAFELPFPHSTSRVLNEVPWVYWAIVLSNHTALNRVSHSESLESQP
jgi:hypothetical protein